MKSVCYLALLATAEAVGPIQKVLHLLEDIKAKVAAEGEVEAEQFEEYSKWCTKTASETGYAIDTGKDKKADFEAIIEQASADISAASAQIEQLASSISANDADLSAATKVREAENADFTATEKELTEAIDQCVRAAQVLRRAGLNTPGSGSDAKVRAALAQVTVGLSTVMDAAFIDASSKRKLSALLEASSEDDLGGAPTAAAYESHSDSIYDTIAELKTKAEQEREALRKDEMNKKHNFEMLKQSLVDATNTRTADLKEEQAGKAGHMEVKSQADGDLASTSDALAKDTSYLKDTNSMCEQKSNDWAQRQKDRAEELAVVSQAIDILGKDDVTAATGRRLGFVQVKSKDDVRDRIAALLQNAAARLHSVGLAQLATRTRVGDDPFTKVRGLISNMITRLQVQAAEEADHKAYCDNEKAKSTAKRGKLAARHEQLTTRVDKINAATAELKEDISTLSGEIAELEANLAEATALRLKEKDSSNSAQADYKVSSAALSQAITVLQEFFSTQGALVQQPMVFEGGYQKKVDGATGIIGMLEVAQADIAKQQAEGEAQESQAVAAFDKMKKQAEVTKTEKSTLIKGKNAEVNRLKSQLADNKSDLSGTNESLDAVISYLDKLRAQCEHKPMTFAERTQRRESEIESLKQALEILDVEATGASLLQKAGFMHKQ